MLAALMCECCCQYELPAQLERVLHLNYAVSTYECRCQYEQPTQPGECRSARKDIYDEMPAGIIYTRRSNLRYPSRVHGTSSHCLAHAGGRPLILWNFVVDVRIHGRLQPTTASALSLQSTRTTTLVTHPVASRRHSRLIIPANSFRSELLGAPSSGRF